jgi:hypothetical protein
MNYIGYNQCQLVAIYKKGGTCRNAYHGMSPYTMGITAHSTWKFAVPAGKIFLFKGCTQPERKGGRYDGKVVGGE